MGAVWFLCSRPRSWLGCVNRSHGSADVLFDLGAFRPDHARKAADHPRPLNDLLSPQLQPCAPLVRVLGLDSHSFLRWDSLKANVVYFFFHFIVPSSTYPSCPESPPLPQDTPHCQEHEGFPRIQWRRRESWEHSPVHQHNAWPCSISLLIAGPCSGF